MFARFISPTDPNHNDEPVRSTTGHPFVQTPWGLGATTVLAQQLVPSNRFDIAWDISYRIRPAFSPGAGYFAYSTLGLVEMTPIGAGVANRMQFRSIEPAAYMPIPAYQRSGIPHDAGMVALQGLQIDNPDLQGYVG